jgi:hypothetical protein
MRKFVAIVASLAIVGGVATGIEKADGAVRRSFAEPVQHGVTRVGDGILGSVSWKVWGNARGLKLSMTLRFEYQLPSGVVGALPDRYFEPFPVKNGFTYTRGILRPCKIAGIPRRRKVLWRLAYAGTLTAMNGWGNAEADRTPWSAVCS